MLGNIPILASEQRLLEEANEREEGGGKDGDASGKKDDKLKEGGGRPRVLADGMYATQTAYMSMSTTRLEAVKAAAKSPLRSGGHDTEPRILMDSIGSPGKLLKMYQESCWSPSGVHQESS